MKTVAVPAEQSIQKAPERLRRTFYDLHARLVKEGFNIVRDPRILRENEFVFNRGLDSEGRPNSKSNFFVFVEVGKELKVFFVNPDYSQAAVKLSSRGIKKVFATSIPSNAWVDEVVQTVVAESKKKPEDVFFGILHGHWGSINGVDLLSNGIDDGASDERTIIRQLMFWSHDIDATGHHNHIIPEFLARIAELEACAGIVKVPSLELTLPYKTGAMNGPHHNIWLADSAAAAEYSSIILSKRSGKYPPYAPLVDPEFILQHNKDMAAQGRLAVGLAHPLSGLPVGVGGLLDRVASTDHNLDWAINHVRDNVHGVACFNPTSSMNMLIDFQNPSERQAIKELLRKWKMGGKITPNAVNMAFSMEMRERFGKFAYSDNDWHRYGPIKPDYHVHGLGKQWTVLKFPGALLRKPTPQEFVSLLLSPTAKDEVVPFVPYEFSDGVINIAKARRNDTFFQKLSGQVVSLWHHLKMVPLILQDFKGKIKSMTS
jgi:hypothetical protein